MVEYVENIICPKCGNAEVFYDHIGKNYLCSFCGHWWYGE